MQYSRKPFNQMTDEELDEIDNQLAEENETEPNHLGNYKIRIRLFKEKYNRALDNDQTDSEDYERELVYTKNMLIDAYVNYGGYLKTTYQKNDYAAACFLRRALRLDPRLPIAYYRLGFLSYKNEKYSEAIKHFQNAAARNEELDVIHNSYYLNGQQKYFTYKYIASSALYVAKNAFQKEEKLRADANKKEADGYKSLSLETLLKENTNELKDQAFCKVSVQDEKIQVEYCSQNECWNIYGQRNEKKLILFFTDQEFLLKYRESTNLSVDAAEKLYHLLRKTGKSNPATRITMTDIFRSKDTDGYTKRNTFVRSIKRLREKLEDAGAPKLIETTNVQNETAYYFNGACPVIIMLRSDSTIVLEEGLI